MKQILQNLRNGATVVTDVPAPSALAGQLLIRTCRSLVSAGTERMLVDFGRVSLIGKARQQPDKVRKVVDKLRTDGLAPTLAALRARLDQPVPLGYCNVGTVIEIGQGVSGFRIGDRVASNGWHAEVVSVPLNLVAKVPDGVGDEAAAFTVLAAVALQGIRLAAPTLGEAVVVTGLGLVGLLTVQLLRAQGCRVLGIDLQQDRLELARRFGAEVVDLSAREDPIAAAARFSRGRGVDAVLITAATNSSVPVQQAAHMCRKRGRIVLVGVAGLELSRADFYEKELTFQVSCSYGPGRHDPAYEAGGQDYPFGLVRWTEQRNLEAVLDMLADGRVDAAPLVSHRFSIAEAEAAYRVLGSEAPSLGIVLEYPSPKLIATDALTARTLPIPAHAVPVRTAAEAPVVSFIGAGNHAMRVLMPAFKAAGAEFRQVATTSGLGSALAGSKFGFALATTDPQSILADPHTETVVIATRHDSHADLVASALAAGKHVYVEKPLCLTPVELDAIEAAHQAGARAHPPRLLMVGFNRRFAPHAIKIRELLTPSPEPKAFIMTVNAGPVPAGHWTLDPQVGGGRIIGEACHFIDLLRFLAGSPIIRYDRISLGGANDDSATLQLAFADGSIGTIHYLANGHRSLAKERLEVFCGGGVLRLDNFRTLRGFGWPGFRAMRLWRQDKGQRACVAAFLAAIRSGALAPIPMDQACEVARISMALSAGARH